MGTNPGTPYRVGRWFDRGADALAIVMAGLPSWGYACPVCLRFFGADQHSELTVDHVPPEAIGGHELVLTCSCNHEAGHSLQNHMIKRHELIAAIRGELGRAIPATLVWKTPEGVEGPPINVELHNQKFGNDDAGMSMLVQVVQRANDPKKVVEHQSLLDQGRGRLGWGVTFTYPKHTFHEHAARVALLRDAYLVAFAKLGYRYIFHPTLDAVRRQIGNPLDVSLQRFSIYMPEAAADARGFYYLKNPADLRALAVQMGRNLVFLPSVIAAAKDIYAALREHAATDVLASEFVAMDWPTEPEHYWDFQRDHAIQYTRKPGG